MRRTHKFDRRHGLRWLDSGGFTMLNKYGDYPFAADEYMNLVARLRPHYYASMDYPCEPEISRRLGLQTNFERIIKTIENTRRLSEWDNHVYSELVPVIQGYSLDEYKFCIDQYHQAGLIREYMAVGSMCRRISSDELHRLIPGIYEHAISASVKRLHFFGLKLDKNLDDLSDLIWSRDSAVALDAYDSDLRASRDGRRWPRGQEEKQAAFISFLGRLDGFIWRYDHERHH